MNASLIPAARQKSKEISRCSHNEIYDIGTEILLLTKNDHNSTQKAPKSIIPQEIKSAGHSPSSGSVKSRFKAIFKKWPSWIRSSRNLWKNVSEYISEYVSEYTSKYVSEYTSEYISECTSERTSDYVREYISEYVSEYTSEYISEYISEYTSA